MTQVLDNVKPIWKGYTQAQLSDAFDAVANPHDWKAPICVAVPGEHVSIVVAAIQFYTATEPTIELCISNMRYVITSEGYRNGPAGDH